MSAEHTPHSVHDDLILTRLGLYATRSRVPTVGESVAAAQAFERVSARLESLEEQHRAALSFLDNINEETDEAMLRMRVDRARGALGG